MPAGFTGLAVGLMLTLIHLVTIPVDAPSVNPARSLSTAVYQGSWALSQLWVFILFPIVGGLIGGLLWKALVPPHDDVAPADPDSHQPRERLKRARDDPGVTPGSCPARVARCSVAGTIRCTGAAALDLGALVNLLEEAANLGGPEPAVSTEGPNC